MPMVRRCCRLAASSNCPKRLNGTAVAESNVVQRLIPQLTARAAELMGGTDLLAAALGAQNHTVRFWIQGKASPPGDALSTMMDLVLQDDIARALQDRRKTLRTIPAGGAPTAHLDD